MAIKIKSKLPTKQEPKLEPKLEVKEIYPDFIDDDGYVNKYDYDGGLYYTTSISMKGPKGNPGPPGRMGKDGITPHINPENHHWMIGDIDTGVNAERTSIVVDTLPTPSEETKDLIYVAPSEHTETGDIYSEYVTVYKNGAYSWEKMGTPINVMGASGNNHRSGLVPDTPSTAGTTKFLREDGTWEAPPAAPVTSVNGQTGAVVLSIPDVSNKEDMTTIDTPVDQTDPTDPITTLSCQLGKYYRIDVPVETLAVTLPAMAANVTSVKTITIYLTGGTTPAVTITSADNKNVVLQDGYEIEAGKTYEVSCLYNGTAWVVGALTINTGE